MRALPSLFALLLLTGCDKDKTPDQAGAKVSTTASTSASAVPSSKPAIDEAAVTALVGKWVEAQNKGEFETYAGFYAPTFQGIRRTSGGTEKKMSLADWKTDRAKMFKKPQKVAAESITVKLAPKITATFVQRWQGGSHADHGKKELVLIQEGGKLLIDREELLNSTVGWADGNKVAVIDGKALGDVKVSLAWVKRADCTPKDDVQCGRLLFTVKGKETKEVVLYDEGSDRPITFGKIKVKKAPLLYEDGWYWAGGGDYFRVVQDGAGIVIKHRVTDEGGLDDPGYDDPTVWPDAHRIELAKDAKVTPE